MIFRLRERLQFSDAIPDGPQAGPVMAVLCLHGPLRKLAGGESQLRLGGSTVYDLLLALVREHPSLTGWILDERGTVRPHINVYVNGELGSLETPVGERDRIEVLPAISGG